MKKNSGKTADISLFSDQSYEFVKWFYDVVFNDSHEASHTTHLISGSNYTQCDIDENQHLML